MKLIFSKLCRVALLAGCLLVSTQGVRADLPFAFDPNRGAESAPLTGSCMVIRGAPLTNHYLIITYPHHTKSFITVEATLAPGVKLGELAGAFVQIKAIRVKPQKEGEPPLQITSIALITEIR